MRATKVLALHGRLGPDHPLRARLAELADPARPSDLGPATRIAAGTTLAEIALFEGAPQVAERQAGATLAELERSPSAAGTQLARVRTIVGIARQEQGRHAEALATLRAADAAYSQALGADHPLVRLYRLDQARSLAALGEGQAAIDLLDKGRLDLAPAFGATTPLLRRIVALRDAMAAAGSFQAGTFPALAFFIN
jgi:hypothetical protein